MRTNLILYLIFFYLSYYPALSDHWSYGNEDEWPALCKEGKIQSPIALSHGIAEETNFPSLIFEDYDLTYLAQSKNNGHSTEIRLISSKHPSARGGGLPEKYILDHLHFHWESEHVMDDQRFPLELHLVHYASKYGSLQKGLRYHGGVAVFSVLFNHSPDDDKELEPFIDTVDKLKNTIGAIQQLNLKISEYLPRDRAGFYRYNGSLTTPACTEGIIWTVFTNRLPISIHQVKYFSLLKTEQDQVLEQNYRPLQELNGRTVQVKTSPIINSSTAVTVWTQILVYCFTLNILLLFPNYI